MTMYQLDPDVTKLVKEGFCNPTHSFVENDEVIAHALHEELSRVAAADASGLTSAGEQPQKELILAQDWLGPSGRDLNSGFQSNEEEVGEKEEISSHLKELSLEGEYEYVLPEIEDESVLDGVLGKRLNQMVPVAHVPKVNGEIPSADEATSDHQRLLNRLQLYELAELKILGDGNCQFRSLSDQIYRTQEHHKFVRDQVVNQLKSHPELYDNYVPMAYGDYLKQMNKSGEWGDHVTLQAAADCYGIKIFVITSFKDTCYTEILPQIQKSNRKRKRKLWTRAACGGRQEKEAVVADMNLRCRLEQWLPLLGIFGLRMDQLHL
ncbi:OVARIAN TUMOR DOMAIN-containing deubiquitinating enzyme 9 [Sesamum angolense]|uniref:ubiquitinyl hydrolase 1 n=1 Tax=Sesamum angolense TaxID=2727404 RepID=A0AAE1W3D5_9LAMI|nr:OVARIAN TUMOR DOMAIN-containing deubiquitinating enzyme 9 [Sesamum angolense]